MTEVVCVVPSVNNVLRGISVHNIRLFLPWWVMADARQPSAWVPCEVNKWVPKHTPITYGIRDKASIHLLTEIHSLMRADYLL